MAKLNRNFHILHLLQTISYCNDPNVNCRLCKQQGVRVAFGDSVKTGHCTFFWDCILGAPSEQILRQSFTSISFFSWISYKVFNVLAGNTFNFKEFKKGLHFLKNSWDSLKSFHQQKLNDNSIFLFFYNASLYDTILGTKSAAILFHTCNFFYTYVNLKISLYVFVHLKIIPWKFHVLNPKNSRVIYQ